jgi:hypothetical protein
MGLCTEGNMVSSIEFEHLKILPKEAEEVQRELDHRVFHLKTLYDVSRDIFASIESEKILRNFLLMTMGNFGILEGFVLLFNDSSKETQSFIPMGLNDDHLVSLEAHVRGDIRGYAAPGTPSMEAIICIHPDFCLRQSSALYPLPWKKIARDCWVWEHT